jgi:hypothetical protein
MTSPLSHRRSYPHLGIATSAVVLIAACSSNPEPGPVVPDPTPAVEAPPPLPPPPQAEAPDKLQAALEALGKSDYTAAYARLMEVVELCGSAPLGQQALLLIAATELDPRNPDPRRSLAAESTSLLLGELDSMSWARQFAESFYLIGRRLGARQLGAEDTEALELGWLFRHGYGRQPPDRPEDGEATTLIDEDSREWAEVESRSSETDYALSGPHTGRNATVAGRTGVISGTSGTGSSPSTGSATRERREEASPHCEALWAAPSVGDGQVVQGVLPSLPGSSYPARVTALRRRVRELEEELERIRRIVSEQ